MFNERDKRMGLKWVVFFVLLDISIQRASANSGLNVEVFGVSSRIIFLKWDTISGAVSYEISVVRRGNTEVEAFSMFGSNIVLGSVHGLEPNTEYTYTVTATDGDGVETTESGHTYSAPERMDDIISVTPTGSTTVMMEFTTVTDVSKYVVRIQKPADLSYFREVEVTSSPAEITDLEPYTEYSFRIMSANDAGTSQPTPSLSAKTLLSPPLIESSSASDSTVELTWFAVPNAEMYTVSLLQHDASESDRMTENTTNLSFTFSGLYPGALYQIEGYAWDAEDRKGEYSAETNQTTRPPAPNSVTVTMNMTNNQLSLSVSWSMDPDVYGEISYNVSSDQGQTCSSSSLFCDLTPVTCGTNYIVTVIALNEAGPSVLSDSVSFITVPCPPETLAVAETTPESCNFTWAAVSHADGYRAFIKNTDGEENTCNTTTETSCSFTCECGYTYFMTVRSYNDAGLSPEGQMLNYTTIPCCPTLMNVSLVSTDTLEVEWVVSRGADLYETRANDSSGVILCNDTAPVCALSYLNCDTSYSVKVIPCNDVSGCNHNCPVLSKETAACSPTLQSLSRVDSSTVTVNWSASNGNASFTVTAKGDQGDNLFCGGTVTSCDITGLLCGSTYEVSVTADTGNGVSIPSYSESYETEPCCPSAPTVTQVTQSMTNVSWSPARGAHTFRTSLSSIKGHAGCHTEDTHCIMGCITCSTSYTVTVEAYSLSGLQTNCTYDGFSSSLCCPSRVRTYRINLNELRVSWHATPGASHPTEVTMTGYTAYNCTADPGENYCDISGVICGHEYTIRVAPVKTDGDTVEFCPYKKYAVGCAGDYVSSVILRGKRSVE